MSSSTTTAAASSTATSAAAETLSLRFLLHDGSDTPKPSFILKTLKSSLTLAKVGDLRGIISGNPQQKEFALYTFCSKDGSSLPDTFPLKDAVELDGGSLTVADSLVPIYIRAPPVSAPVPKVETKMVAAPELDLSLTDKPQLLTSAALAARKSSYTAAQYTAAVAAATSNGRAADLKEADWFVVAQNNALHRGFVVDRQKQSGSTAVNAIGMSNARRTAFQFKRREVPNFSVSGSGSIETMLSLRVPNYIVDDQSYVSVYETSNTFQASLAESAFSEVDVKASVSGGAFGYSVGVSAGYSESASSATASASMQTANRMHISYNEFPRVSLILDEECLEMTDQCKRDVAAVTDLASMRTFLGLYGQFFPKRVQLGGRLFASDESSTVAGSSTSEKAKSMKAGAAVSFGSSFLSASVSASYGSGSNSAQGASNSSFSSSLSWQATGGDTLLCNNPAAWCPTVAPYYHWRITKQDNVAHILDVIGSMPGYSALPAQWRALDTSGTTTQVTVPTASYFKFQSTRTDVSNLYLCAFSASQWSLANVQNVRAAQNVGASSPDMTELAKYGSVADHTNPANDATSGNKWQLETMDGSPVQTPKYNTNYVLKNISVGCNLYWQWETGTRFNVTHSNAWRNPMWFENPSGGTTATDIADGALVRIAIRKSADDSTSLYPTILESGVASTNYYLMPSPTTKATWTMRKSTT